MCRQWIADNWYGHTSVSLPWALSLCYALGDTAFWQHNLYGIPSLGTEISLFSKFGGCGANAVIISRFL